MLGQPRKSVSLEWAEQIAIEGLAYLAADAEKLDRFLALTGLGPDTLRAAASESWFLPAVLGHILEDERIIIAFSQTAGIKPEEIARAHAQLSGPVLEA